LLDGTSPIHHQSPWEVVGSANTMTATAEIQSGDDSLDRLSKSIPAEFAATFLAINSFTEPADEPVKSRVLIGAIILMLLLLPIYQWKVRGIKVISQHVVSLFALVIWAVNINPTLLGSTTWYNPYYGGALLILWAIVAPIVTTRK
jgi:hypothetical protein